MAQYTYEGTMDGSLVGQPFNGYWSFKYILDLTKTGNTSWDWTLAAYIKLGSHSSTKVFKAQNKRSATDPLCSFMIFGLSGGLYDSGKIYKPYGPISSNDGFVHYNTISGSFNIEGRFTTTAYGMLEMGWGSSLGTGTGSFGAYTGNIVTLELVGIIDPTVTDPWFVSSTTTTLSSKYDINWGYEAEDGTRKPYTRLYASNTTTLLQTKNTNEATFTGLTRYTPYYVQAYAENSVGSDTSNKVLMYTQPENPTIAAPTISNSTVSSPIQGVASVTVTPGVVTDNGGKAITEVETFIKGGNYGSSLVSIGKGTGAKNLTSLLPNTQYSVVTKATNGITENYSNYTTFTTLGNPPEITDLYASNLLLTGATINYTAKYEHNASFSKYQVQWRYPGETTWKNLTASTNVISGTNFDSLTDNRIEYRITVTDNWNRSTTSNVLSYRVLYNYSNDITNFKAVRNSDDTFTVSGNWTTRLYNKIDVCLILSHQSQQNLELAGNFSNLVMTNTGFSFKTKQFKNKYIHTTFYLFISLRNNNDKIYKHLEINKLSHSDAINTINTSGNLVSRQFSSIGYNKEGKIEIKRLRRHDIIKLSRKMRYIDIDSRGTSSNISISKSSTDNVGRFTIDYSYTISHISKNLYMLEFTKFRIKTNDNSVIRVRNNNLFIVINNSDSLSYKLSFTIPNITINSNYQEIDVNEYYSYFLQGNTNPTVVKGNMLVYWKPEFDYQQSLSTQLNFSQSKNYGNADITNNHLVSIKVYDKDNIDRAAGKSIKLTDGTNPIIYNSGNPTNGTTDSNKFIYSENGLPLRLDLGQEYEISRIQIQRRILTDNTYSRNYIIGRNGNKEICYIFYDSNKDNEYKESNKIFNIK